MRKKIFGLVATPLDRNEKTRLLHRARALMRATMKGKAYGPITAKTYAVYCALLMQFHNSNSGRCFPSYEAICAAADCCRASVATALAVLEETGLLSVSNRLVRVQYRDRSLTRRTRVCRTSNCYAFPSTRTSPPLGKSSKSGFEGGTKTQVLPLPLAEALDRLQEAIRGANKPAIGGLSDSRG